MSDVDNLGAGPSSAAKDLLRVILDTNKVSDAQVAQYHRERLHDRRVQITNLDRARPKAGDNDTDSVTRAENKLIKRKRRVKSELSQLKRMRIEARRQPLNEPPSTSSESVQDKQKRLSVLKRELRSIQTGAKSACSSKKIDRLSQKQLSRSQRKKIGLEDIDDNISIDLIRPLHDLWCSYIQQLLNIVSLDGRGDLVPNPHFNKNNLSIMSAGNVSALQASLIKADLCGAEIEVVRASNPSLVSQRGLVVKETERTIVLAIATPADIQLRNAANGKNVRIIPKHNTVFSVFVPVPSTSHVGVDQLQFELHGSHMMHTLPSRATRKYKARATIDF